MLFGFSTSSKPLLQFCSGKKASWVASEPKRRIAASAPRSGENEQATRPLNRYRPRLSARRRGRLLPDRQAPNSPARSGKDGVAEGRGDGWDARLAGTAERHAPVGSRQQVHPDIARRSIHARHAILVKVILL